MSPSDRADLGTTRLGVSWAGQFPLVDDAASDSESARVIVIEIRQTIAAQDDSVAGIVVGV